MMIRAQRRRLQLMRRACLERCFREIALLYGYPARAKRIAGRGARAESRRSAADSAWDAMYREKQRIVRERAQVDDNEIPY